MPTDDVVDAGLLAPLGPDGPELIGDAAVLDALVTVELALARAWARQGVSPEASDRASAALGWAGRGNLATGHGLDVATLAAQGAAGGNPVIPLVGALRERLDGADRAALHRGATSQDVLDSALMLIVRRATERIVTDARAAERALARLIDTHRASPAVARTLGQHAVPTTIGLRLAPRLVALRRARSQVESAAAALPAQFGGAAGTLAAAVEHARMAGHGDPRGSALEVAAALADELALAAPELPWHVTRWPVTEVGDALTRLIDAAGALAADVALLSRSEIGELSEGTPGGSSAMPHKRNPVDAVLIRGAALRAPFLAATLHAAAAQAVDQRPDGAWHAEWPTLRDLTRLALGTAAALARLTDGLIVDTAAAARHLAASAADVLAERRAVVGADSPEAHDLDPSHYQGAADALVDRALDEAGGER
ncbi:lyase family protein [Microcella sp.]|uniref:lyase family protein n=1 Tax=Microcella sp. TaxID=1913979 RepID=UPI0039190E3A